MTAWGHNITTYFARLTRNWHNACNKRGLIAETQIQHLFAMQHFLTAGINFDKFPGKCSECYIRGMPVETFEGILQCISTQIFLYNFSIENNYNTRSVSTLVNNESFFSDLISETISLTIKTHTSLIMFANLNAGVRECFRVNGAKILPEFCYGLLPQKYQT